MKWFDYCKMRQISLVLLLTLGLIASVANADFTFGTPTNLGSAVNSLYFDGRPSISTDGLSLYFGEHPGYASRPGGLGASDIWITTRKTTSEPWAPPVNVGQPVNSSANEFHPWISSDGLSLYFCSDRPGGYGSWDIWVASRTTDSDAWSTPVNLGPKINTASYEAEACASPDGLELYFPARDWPGGFGGWDIWLATKPTKGDPWTEPVNLGSIINTNTTDGPLCLSPDGLMLFFKSRWPYGDQDMYVTTRATTSDPWGPPVNLGPNVNTRFEEAFLCVSSDGMTLYFSSDRPGGYGSFDLWQAPIIPIVDFNCDGVVDSADMCIMVDHWGTDNSQCDIGPTPLGDGVVDVQDLIVLAKHLFQEVFPPELVAYWKLDEAEGDIAYESVDDNNGTINGEPLWQPEGGIVAGALEFDGIDDYISTDFTLNPADGPFSVFAWIKGGAAGQVVLSQTGGANWLSADPLEGNLMTELVPATTRSPSPPFVSETKIIDGKWHHIGFVWSGACRTLYVDGVVVAEDTQNNLAGSSNGLYIGTGNNLAAGTFFSGLIDDVRIYNKALSLAQIAALAE